MTQEKPIVETGRHVVPPRGGVLYAFLRVPSRLAIALIRFYQEAISPHLAPSCRFEPSCSHYALGCYRRFGVLRATRKTAWRLCRCHPFHPGGYDPVEGP